MLHEIPSRFVRVGNDDLDALFSVEPEPWLAECDLTEEYFDRFGARLPKALRAELASLRYHLTE